MFRQTIESVFRQNEISARLILLTLLVVTHM
jgi:hypothetical protein